MLSPKYIEYNFSKIYRIRVTMKLWCEVNMRQQLYRCISDDDVCYNIVHLTDVRTWMFLFHVGLYKDSLHLCHWWNLRISLIIEHRTWQCWWFFCWIELVHWVLVEDNLVLLVVWVCHKGRSNHCCGIELWIHWYNRHLSESINSFGLNDIKFWY